MTHRLAAICPLCAETVLLDGLHADDQFQAHLAQHSHAEFVASAMFFCRAVDQIDHLRRTPHWAMPHA